MVMIIIIIITTTIIITIIIITITVTSDQFNDIASVVKTALGILSKINSLLVVIK